MGWFWAESEAPKTVEAKCPVNHAKPAEPAKCPVDHKAVWRAAELSEQAKCPVDHTKLAAKPAAKPSGWFSWTSSPEVPAPAEAPVHAASSEPLKCPVDHEKRSWWSRSNNSELNPLNNMPDLSSQRAPGQQEALPTDRTLSTIPKGTADGYGVWEYPSPQQMLNAMLRKGGPVPEDAVESMVDVHNFLNEGAWHEILKWEDQYTSKTKIAPRLLKFTGRPDDMSPRAQMLQVLARIFPAKYGTQPPFDRHDWTVLRADGKDEWQPVRYVIDYYAGPDNDEGMPTFILDVRPAIDSVGSAVDRLSRVSGSVWSQAMGKE